MPTALYPELRTDMAMSLGGVISPDGVSLAALVREAKRWALDPARTRAAATRTAELALDAVDQAAVIDRDGALAQHIRRKATDFMQ